MLHWIWVQKYPASTFMGLFFGLLNRVKDALHRYFMNRPVLLKYVCLVKGFIRNRKKRCCYDFVPILIFLVIAFILNTCKQWYTLGILICAVHPLNDFSTTWGHIFVGPLFCPLGMDVSWGSPLDQMSVSPLHSLWLTWLSMMYSLPEGAFHIGSA